MKERREPSHRGEEVSQDLFSSSQAPSPLLAEARALGWRYWARVVVGFFVMIFFIGLVCNVYLFAYYKQELQDPCKLCLDLNPQAERCIPPGPVYIGEEEGWLYLNPIKALGKKAAKLQLPCDACAKLNPGNQTCIDALFEPKKEINQTIKKISLEGLNLTLGPAS